MYELRLHTQCQANAELQTQHPNSRQAPSQALRRSPSLKKLQDMHAFSSPCTLNALVFQKTARFACVKIFGKELLKATISRFETEQASDLGKRSNLLLAFLRFGLKGPHETPIAAFPSEKTNANLALF